MYIVIRYVSRKKYIVDVQLKTGAPIVNPTTHSITRVRRCREIVDEAATVLESNARIMTTLSNVYLGFREELTRNLERADAVTITKALGGFVSDIDEHVRETNMLSNHLTILSRLLSERKIRVSMSHSC
jgi:hypothetical protein